MCVDVLYLCVICIVGCWEEIVIENDDFFHDSTLSCLNAFKLVVITSKTLLKD